MLKNYFKIALRSISRNKAQALINVAGLSLGIACCLFIFLWVKDEESIDNFHANGKNLYTVYLKVSSGTNISNTYTTPVSFDNSKISFLLKGIEDKIPEIKREAFYATGYELPWGHPETFQAGEKIVKLEGSRAGKDFFKMFSYPLIEGNPENALNNLTSIAVSRKMAEIFFGSPKNAMGKSIRFENRQNFIVTSVFENLPNQSSLKFDYLFNWDVQSGLIEWASPDFQTYIELTETADIRNTEAKINQYLQSRMAKDPNVRTEVGLQRFGDKYLHNIFVNGRPEAGRIEYVRLFSGIAIFILIIACINFMNLATARSIKRAKEIGLRKVVGSTRSQLIGQFLSEALLFSFISILASGLLLIILLPAFNSFTGKQITIPITELSFWAALIILMLVTALVAGSYPALYLSSLKPVRIFKGALRFTEGSILFRKGLTVFQFALSIILIISTIIISRQTSYVQNTHLGYNKENLIYVRIEGELSNRDKYLLFKERASRMPGIEMIDRSTEAPHAMNFEEAKAINWQGKEKNVSVGFKPASVGFDFVKLMKLTIAEGRDFSPLNATDSSDAFMVNEEAVKEMGMKDPIGKWVSAWNKKGHIIGVIKDYHTQSLREPIKPVMIDVKEYEYFGVIIIRSQPGKIKEAIASLSKVYKEINPNYAFAFQFVDEEYKKLYNSEQVISKLSTLFAGFAIIISCLGLLGLAMFAAEQRIKEIGIRKVLGASIGNLVSLFSQEFIKLVFIAFLIAAPIAWIYMNHWLKDFAYKVDVSWWVFLLAGAISIFIALATISHEAIKAAVANPVKSLRTE
ncbi:MAG TPA: FtsX-like permease family protein [Puia sp.]|nr:FtsX-like permease family protein [Puia sp.]